MSSFGAILCHAPRLDCGRQLDGASLFWRPWQQNDYVGSGDGRTALNAQLMIEDLDEYEVIVLAGVESYAKIRVPLSMIDEVAIAVLETAMTLPLETLAIDSGVMMEQEMTESRLRGRRSGRVVVCRAEHRSIQDRPARGITLPAPNGL